VNDESAVRLADEFVGQLEPYPGDRFDGRGIVIPAGGITYNTGAWVTIRRLRQLGCQLPIQVWYNGPEEADPNWHSLAKPLGVECIDSQEVTRTFPHRDLKGWAIKPYAMLHCRFREVLLLDADNVPVRDPTYLFLDEDYQRYGTMFWPDGNATAQDRLCWQAFGVDYRDEPAQESGQILVDKAKCWHALNLCNWYNEHAYFYWRFVFGDKDTFRFAWHRLDQPFAMTSHPLVLIPWTLCQHDMAGRRVFQHRAHVKWSLGGNPRSRGFWYEEECLELIDELRQKWDPLEHLTGHLDEDDRRQMADLEGKALSCRSAGYRATQIALGTNNRITKGLSTDVELWWCENGELVLASKDGRPVGRLRQDKQGIWTGKIERRPPNWRPLQFR
jgi:hypothetical protein